MGNLLHSQRSLALFLACIGLCQTLAAQANGTTIHDDQNWPAFAASFLNPSQFSYDLDFTSAEVAGYQEKLEPEVLKSVKLLFTNAGNEDPDLDAWERTYQNLFDWLRIEAIAGRNVTVVDKQLAVSRTSNGTRQVPRDQTDQTEPRVIRTSTVDLWYAPDGNQLNLRNAPGYLLVFLPDVVFWPLVPPRHQPNGLAPGKQYIGSETYSTHESRYSRLDIPSPYTMRILQDKVSGLPYGGIESSNGIIFHLILIRYNLTASSDFIYPIQVNHIRRRQDAITLDRYGIANVRFAPQHDAGQLVIADGVGLFDWRATPLKYFGTDKNKWPACIQSLVAAPELGQRETAPREK